MQSEPKKSRDPAPPDRSSQPPQPAQPPHPPHPPQPRSAKGKKDRVSGKTPPPESCDIACAIDALSCIESGDPSVLSLLSQTAYSLGVDDSVSSTSSNCSTSSFDDDDHIVMHKRNQSDDDDINENYPVDAHKVAAISSAFSSHHLPPKRSKVHRIRTNFSKNLEPQQMAQFLLPLFTSQSEEIYSDQFVKIKHEDILQALTSANLTCDTDESIPLSSESPLSAEETQLLLHFKKFFNPADLHNMFQIPPPILNESSDKKLKSHKSDSNSVRNTDKTSKKSKSDKSKNEVFNCKEDFNIEVERFLLRKCCTNKFLAKGGECSVNKCHEKWKLVKEGLIKFILIPGQFDFTSSTEDDLCNEINIPQIVFDCDSINTRERFLFGNQIENFCPGGCGNKKLCKRYIQDFKIDLGCPEDCQVNEDMSIFDITDEHIILMDIKAAWSELKILLFWLYWVSNEGCYDFDDFAIGFETVCNCCYCYHAKNLAMFEKSKYVNLSDKERHSIYSHCTCRKRKSNHNGVEHKCQFCKFKENEENSSETLKSTLADYLKYINLPAEQCCCKSSQRSADFFFKEEITPIYVCHMNKDLPPVYLDMTSIDELSSEDVELMLTPSTKEFYTTSCEKWRENSQAFINNELYKDHACERCRCSCNKPKFYGLFQITSRITELIDNLIRLDFPFFFSMIDAFYSSLFCRYSTCLLFLYSNGCGFSFFKELTQIVQSIRKCGTWLMETLGAKRLRLTYTLFFALPGQQFLNNIYWKWADAPALDHFLKLSVMLFHDVISHEWRSLVVDFLDILPYLYDAAVLSDINDIFVISRQSFARDDHLSKMYECFSLIQKKYLNKSLIWHSELNNSINESLTNVELNAHKVTVSKFLKKFTKSLKPRKIEIELLTKFCTNAWNDFEKLLAYSLIKAYAIGHFINNEYLNYWIKKVFCFCIDPDAFSKCVNKTKLSLQIFIDLMAYHKNGRRLKQNVLSQISIETHRDKIDILIKAFHSKHFGDGKSGKINLKMDRYINLTDNATKNLNKHFNSDFTQPDLLDGDDNKNSTRVSDNFKKFNPVNLLVDFFGALYNKDSTLKKREVCNCNFHKNFVLPKQNTKVVKPASNVGVCADDAEISELGIDIPENFDYDSCDEMVNDSDNEDNDQYDYDSSDCEVENIKIPSSLIPANFNCSEKKEKWSIFTAKLLSNHASNISKSEMSCSRKTVINDFIENDIKNSQHKNGCYKKMYENTLKIIKRSSKLDNENLDLDLTVLFENIGASTCSIMDERSNDDNEDLLLNMLPDAISNLDRSEQFKNLLMSEFNTTMKEVRHLCEVFDAEPRDEKGDLCAYKVMGFKPEYLMDPSIDEIEDEMQKLMRTDITKTEFELDLHIVCYYVVTRNMLREVTSPSKEKYKTTSEKKKGFDPARKAKSIAGYFVDDYWVSLKGQFEKWRLVSLKMYQNLIILHKKTTEHAPSLKDINSDFRTYYGFVRSCLVVSAMNRRINNSVKGTANLTKKNVSMFHIYVATWLFVVNEIERLEKKNEKQESIRKKQFEETREAELLGGRGLSKMINKCSEKSSSPNTNNIQPKKDTAKVTTQPQAKKSAFQQSVEQCLKHFDTSNGTSDSKVDISIKQNSKGDEVTSITFIHTSNKTTKVISESDNKQKNSKSSVKVAKSESKTPNVPVKSVNSVQTKENSSELDKIVENPTGQSKNKSSNSTALKDSGKEKCGINHETHEKCYTEGKCPLHPDSSRSNHSQSGDHPCNCCYCTVFGQVPPMTGPVSRNFNETRERLRTILNKKKMSEKGKEDDKNLQAATSETTNKESDKIERQPHSQVGNFSATNNIKPSQNANKPQATASTNKESSTPTDDPVKPIKPRRNKEILNELLARHSKAIDDFVKQRKLKKPNSVESNSSDTKINASPKNNTNIVENKTVTNSSKDVQDSKKSNIKPQTKVNINVNKIGNLTEHATVLPPKSENSNDSKSQRCHSGNRVDPKKKQDVPLSNQIVENKTIADKKLDEVALKKLLAAAIKSSTNNTINKSTCYSNTHSTKSSEGSFCSSPTCPGCGGSGYKDDRDINMLVKFIEEPHRAVDKEKKQAKKARQKNKKLTIELLKEREELHEDLISMVGETSRLREEVVRLEQGLASACRRLPPANKYNGMKNPNSDADIDLEEHECALLLKHAAQEASARATEAATLAEQAHSRLRHVESALNLLSSSVNRACVKHQKLGQNEETIKKPKNPTQSQGVSSVYNMDQVLYQNSEFYNTSGSNQGMVTIKRVLLPNSDEHGVTITPKGSDHLIYNSQDHCISPDMEKLDSDNKQCMPRKQNLSWESTIAQINTLANSKKKPKAIFNEKKKAINNPLNDHKGIDVSKKKVKIETSSQKNTSAIVPQPNIPPVTKKNKKTTITETIEEISVEPVITKKNLKKMRKATLKAELELTSEIKNSGNKFETESAHKQSYCEDNANNTKTKKIKNSNKSSEVDNMKTDRKNDTKKTNQKQEVPEKTQSKTVSNKSNKTVNTIKVDSSEPGVKVQKNGTENTQNQLNSQKNKKSNQSLPTQKTSTEQKTSAQLSKAPNNPQSSLQIVNSLTSAVDKIKLNDDTTIELASSKKDQMTEAEENLLAANSKNAPVSSSIMEQLRSGVQFADLRLPPGITLTRVDPAKQHNVSKSNIPLMTSATPSAYRPTPPAPPPPAVIMVDTTKLHADRESKSQAPPNLVDPKKPSKSKKSKKKNKKPLHLAQQTSGATSVHTSSVNSTNEQPKMVTLRNPMFHSTLTPSGMVNLQAPGKKINDIRLPDPIPMPPNASCQATITPTSNGMYTIRNPLMSIYHQRSMMGMNSMDSPTNPILLMANQHPNPPTPHTYCSNICDDQSSKNACDSSADLKESINSITNRLSNCSLEKCKEDSNNFEAVNNQSKNFGFKNRNKFSPVSQIPEESHNSNIYMDDKSKIAESTEKHPILTPSPIGATRHQENKKDSVEKPIAHIENPIQKPIGTPFSQYSISEVSKSSETSMNLNQIDMTEPQKLYTPFGPTDPDKTFGSILYQPFAREPNNESIWSNKSDIQNHQISEDKTRMSPYVHRIGTSRVIVDSDHSYQQLDVGDQSKNWKNNQTKTDGYCDPKSLQGGQPAQPSHPSVYQHLLYEATKESLINSKAWSNGVYPHEHDYYKYYSQYPTGLSPLHHAKLSHSSSSSCVPSDSSSVYDSISNSSSNSPADSTNIISNPSSSQEYSYMSPHQISVLKTGSVKTCENYVDLSHSVNQDGFNSYSGLKTAAVNEINDKCLPNIWRDSFPQYRECYGPMNNSMETTSKYDPSANSVSQNPIGSQRVSNGLSQNESFYTETSSVFAPDQSITNLNELDSSERDIESFKRFDYYFEPPKNKPKISLNVQDIAFQRPSPTKPIYRNN